MFGVPMFEFDVFRKQMYCIEESTCDIVVTFRRPPQSFDAPRNDSALGELCPPWPLSLRPGLLAWVEADPSPDQQN